jgi:NADH-quinone oxidoreductase subunit J
MTVDLLLFIGLALVAYLAAVGMLASRNAVYSALFLVLNFMAVAVIFLLLGAAFIAMVQVTVYAGAIMVLFLFVIMLLGSEREGPSARAGWQAPVAVTLALALVAEFAIVLFGRAASPAALPGGLPIDFGSPRAVGQLLFDRYLVPFEITSVLLLAAMVGAIVLTRDQKKEPQ